MATFGIEEMLEGRLIAGGMTNRSSLKMPALLPRRKALVPVNWVPSSAQEVAFPFSDGDAVWFQVARALVEQQICVLPAKNRMLPTA